MLNNSYLLPLEFAAGELGFCGGTLLFLRPGVLALVEFLVCTPISEFSTFEFPFLAPLLTLLARSWLRPPLDRLLCLLPRRGVGALPGLRLLWSLVATGALEGLRTLPVLIPLVCATSISGAIRAMSGSEFGADNIGADAVAIASTTFRRSALRSASGKRKWRIRRIDARTHEFARFDALAPLFLLDERTLTSSTFTLEPPRIIKFPFIIVALFVPLWLLVIAEL